MLVATGPHTFTSHATQPTRSSPEAASRAFASAGPADGVNSAIRPDPLIVSLDLGHAAITVQAKDEHGTELTTGGDTVVLSTSHGSLSAVTDNHDGTYSATLTDSVVGVDFVSGSINGETMHQVKVTFTAAPSCTVHGGFETCVYGHDATGFGGWRVPDGLTSPIVTVEARGGSGGDGVNARGGRGGIVVGHISVSAGDQVLLTVAGHGTDAQPLSADTHIGATQPPDGGGAPGKALGGFPDGGNGSEDQLGTAWPTRAGGGGGRTEVDVLRKGEFQIKPAVIAGGGGGAGSHGGLSYGMAEFPGAVPRGGDGGDADSAGQPGEGGAIPFFACGGFMVSGGNPGGPGTGSPAGGAGGVGGAPPAFTCFAMYQSGDGRYFSDVPTGGKGALGNPGYAGWSAGGGGGGGGIFGGGGGGAGGIFSFYRPPDDSIWWDLSGGGGGGGGGASGSDTSLVSDTTLGVSTVRGDGSVSVTFAIGDITPPHTTIDVPPEDPTGRTDATVTFSGTDAGGSGLDHFECRLDGGSWDVCASPKTFPGLAAGPHTVSVRAVDGNGNIEPTPASASWTFVDTTPPETSIDSAPSDPSYVPTASISFSGTDNSGAHGIHHFECSLDSAAFTPCTSPAAVSGLSPGGHTFAVKAVDRGGNGDSSPAQARWIVADSPPSTCTANGAGTACTYTLPSPWPYRTFTVPDNVTHLTITADGAGGGDDTVDRTTGGRGGQAVATVGVTPEEVLRIYLGGRGSDSDTAGGGANGGGDGPGRDSGNGLGGSGGGASDVRRAPYALGDRLVVAGGGGGAATGYEGGDGGGASGAPGSGPNAGQGGSQTQGGGAGTSSAGCGGFFGVGSTAGALGAGGRGASCNGFVDGGGGGGGYYGGGGGGDDITSDGDVTGGGGGGSSYAVPGATAVALTTGGGQTGDGVVTISYATTTDQAITVTTDAPAAAEVGTHFTVAASGGGSPNPVAFSSSGACTNLGAVFTVSSAAGTCTVMYDQAGDADYNAAPQVAETTRVVDATVTLSGIATGYTDRVGATRTYTAHVSVNDGSGLTNAPAGTRVGFTKDSGVGSFTTATPCSTIAATGSCTITLTSAQTGKTTISAHATTTVAGVTLQRDSNQEHETWVDARISVSPTGAKEVNAPATFTVTVQKDLGDGNGFVAASGEHVAYTLANSNGAAHTAESGTCTNAGANTSAAGQCNLTFSSPSAGKVTGHASATVDVGGVPIGLATDGASGNSSGAIVTFVDAAITVSGGTTDRIGGSRALSAHVTVNDGTGAGFTSAPAATLVSFTRDSGGGSFTTSNPCSTVGATGSCAITLTSTQTGVSSVSAHTSLAVGGVAVQRDSTQTAETWVDARISVAASATHEVGAPHSFTVTVKKDLGDGNGLVAASGEHVAYTLANSNGAAHTAESGTCAGAGANTSAAGQCTLTFSSPSAGRVTAHASSTVTVRGLQIDAATAPDAVATFVDARMRLSPLTSSSGVGTPASFTAHVDVDDGSGAGFVDAPNGTGVTFSLTNAAGASTTFVGGSTCATAGGNGSCGVVVSSSTLGTTTMHAGTAPSVGGAVLVRATGDGHAGDGADAHQAWVDITPPVTTITLTPATPDVHGWYVFAATPAASAIDASPGTGVAGTRCQLDAPVPPANGDYGDLQPGCAYLSPGHAVLTEGSHTLYAASIDSAGNEESIEKVVFKIDKTPPTASVDALEHFQGGVTFPVEWSAVDNLSGAANYDVRYRQAASNGTFGSYVTWLTRVTATSASLNAPAGSTTCFAVRATDVAGWTGPWSAEACTTAPVDDPGLTRSGSWSTVAGTGYYGPSVARAGAIGSSLAATLRGQTIGVLVTKQPGGGTVQLRWNGATVLTQSLSSSSVQKKQLLTFTLTSVQSGTLQIVAAGSGTVDVDGAGAYKTS